jgi:predicted enzyme related to lactoylglutathione lyase
MPKTIVHFEIPAGDVDRLSRFYSDAFSWNFDKVPMEGMEYWMIKTGSETLGGGMYPRQMEGERLRFYVDTEAIDSEIERLKGLGANVLVEKQEVPGQGYTVILNDPEGNAFGLFQPLRPQPRSSSTKNRSRRSSSRTRKRGASKSGKKKVAAQIRRKKT